MGITTDMFCKFFKANAKGKDKTLDEFIQKHIVTQYIDFITKDTYCTNIVKASCHIKDGDREIIKINGNAQYLFFTMRLIDLYTDIDIDQENVASEYDKLNQIGAVDAIIKAIPLSEYAEFSTMLSTKMNDFRNNEYSVTALLHNLTESLSISEEIINSAIEEITKQSETNK